MRRVYAIAATLIVLSGLLVGCGKPATGPTSPAPTPPPPPPAPAATQPSAALQVFVPCGMIVPVKAVVERFEAIHPDTKVTGVYDNAIVLAERVTKKREPADVFVSPGSAEIGILEKVGLVDPAARRAIGDFELVVITGRGNPLGLKSPADLKRCKTISTPDPSLNSVGLSGKQALTRLGLWNALQPKLVATRHAIQSHTMVAGGKADAGIAYRNCPLETNPEKLSKSKVTVAFSFNPRDYTRQQCLVAPLKTAPNPAGAGLFVEFIASDEGRQLLAAKGMTGCLDLKPDKTAKAPAAGAKPVVTVRAFYPGNEGHAAIRRLIEGLPVRYKGRVAAKFVDFTSDAGFKEWQAAGLSCGAILINDQQTWTYMKGGKPVEVTFKMAMGGEWSEPDLHAVIEKLLKEAKR